LVRRLIGMEERRDSGQPERSEGLWPTYPAPPGGGHAGGRVLIGIGYLTTAAIYLTVLVQASSPLQSVTWVAVTALFSLFGLCIHLFSRFFHLPRRRLAFLLLQIALVFAIVVVAGGGGSVAILYFIVVPMAYLSFGFVPASGLALLCLGALFISYWIVEDAREALALMLPYGGGFAFFAAVSRALIQQQKDRQRAERLLLELEDAHRQLRVYAVQVEALAVTEERNRLAREIHDSLGHYLTAMTMQLQAAGKLVTQDPERAAESIAKAEDMARDSLAEVRRSVAALRVSPLDGTTLADAIGELVQGMQESGLAATVVIAGESQSLPIQVKRALYRAAQEGLTNVRKHAKASALGVELAYEPERVSLTISDNGTGRHGAAGEGFGLLGLRERVALLGGALEAGNAPGGGFRLHVTVPLHPEEQVGER